MHYYASKTKFRGKTQWIRDSLQSLCRVDL